MRQAEILGGIGNLLEDRRRHLRVFDQARDSAQGQSFAVALLDRVQAQFGQLVAVEAADRNDASKGEIVRKAGAIQRRREIVIRRLCRVSPGGGQQLTIALKQIVRERILHIAPKEIAQAIKDRPHSAYRRSVHLQGVQIVVAGGDEHVGTGIDCLVRQGFQEISRRPRLAWVVAAGAAFVRMNRDDHEIGVLARRERILLRISARSSGSIE